MNNSIKFGIRTLAVILIFHLISCRAHYSQLRPPPARPARGVSVKFCNPETGAPLSVISMTEQRVGLEVSWQGADPSGDGNHRDMIVVYIWQDNKPHPDSFNGSVVPSAEPGNDVLDLGFFLPPLAHEGLLASQVCMYDGIADPGPPYPNQGHVYGLKAASTAVVRLDLKDDAEPLTRKQQLASGLTWAEYTGGLPSFHIMPFWPLNNDAHEFPPQYTGLNNFRRYMLQCPLPPTYNQVANADPGPGISDFVGTRRASRGNGTLLNSGSWMWSNPWPNYPMTTASYRDRLNAARQNNPNNWLDYIADPPATGFQQASYLGFPNFKVDATKGLSLGSNCQGFVWHLLNKAKYKQFSELVPYNSKENKNWTFVNVGTKRAMTKYFQVPRFVYIGDEIYPHGAPGDIVEYWFGGQYNHTGLIIHTDIDVPLAATPTNWVAVSCDAPYSIWKMGTSTHLIGAMRDHSISPGEMNMNVDVETWGLDWPVDVLDLNNWDVRALRVMSTPE